MTVDILLLIILLIPLLLDISKDSEGKENDGYEFGLTQSRLLKGVCAFLILLHHITQRTGGEVFLHFGYLGVAGFLFISGFGMTCQWQKKGSAYAGSLLKKNIPLLLVMCLVTVMYTALYYTMMGEILTTDDFITIFRGNRLLNWYFIATILIYLLYVVAVKFAKESDRKLLACLFVLLTLWNILLGIFYMKGFLGIHWLVSNYALWGGCTALYIRKIYFGICLRTRCPKFV